MDAKSLFMLTEEEETLRRESPAALEPLREIARQTCTLSHFDKQRSNEAWDFFRDSGFTGFGIPEKPYGGIGGSSRGLVIFNEELSSIDSALGLLLGATLSLTALPILAWGTDDQKLRFLPLFASGEYRGCYIQTEPGAGSDVAGILGKARKENGVWRITKDCCFITNGDDADIGLVLARTDVKPDDRHYGLTMFIVDLKRARREGTYSFYRNEEKAGLHLSATTAFKLENCVAEEILGEENHGWDVAMSTLVGSRGTAIPSQGLGLIRGARDRAQSYMEGRIQFGFPLDKIPVLRFALRRIDAALHTARLLTWRAAVYKDALGVKNWREFECEASQAKLFAAEAAEWAVSEAMQAMGGVGYMMKDGIGKFWHDGRIIKIYEGTSGIQEMIIMRRLLKRFDRDRLKWLVFRMARLAAAKHFASEWPVFSSAWPTEEKEFKADIIAASVYAPELRDISQSVLVVRARFLRILGKTLSAFPPNLKNTFPSPYFKLAYAFAALEGAKLALWDIAFRAKYHKKAPEVRDTALATMSLLFADERVSDAEKSVSYLLRFPSFRKEIEGR